MGVVNEGEAQYRVRQHRPKQGLVHALSHVTDLALHLFQSCRSRVYSYFLFRTAAAAMLLLLAPGHLNHWAFKTMAIHMGIMCARCGTLHFIATSAGIALSKSMADAMYKLVYARCSATTLFAKNEIRPCLVSEEVFRKGYAREGEYEFVVDTTIRP